MTTITIEALYNALAQSDNYPKNLPWLNTFEHSVKAVKDQLAQRSSKLFPVDSSPSQASVGIFELYGEQEGI
jgi:hypothetical protein